MRGARVRRAVPGVHPLWVRLAGTLVALAVAIGPMTVHAAPKGGGPDPRVEELYLKGQDMFADGNFSGAAATWVEVLDILAEADSSRATRENVLLNAISAYQEAYKSELDGGGNANKEHLCSATAALQDYTDALRQAYPDGPERAASQSVRNAGSELRAFIREQEGKPATELCAKEQVEEGGTEPIIPIRPVEPRDPDDDPTNRPTGRGLIIAGSVLLGVGVACSAKIIAGSVLSQQAEEDYNAAMTNEERDDADKRGRAMNNLAIAGAVIVPVFVIAGATMLGIGLRRRARLGRGEVEGFLPQVGPRYVGLGFRRRF